MCHQSPEKGQ